MKPTPDQEQEANDFTAEFISTMGTPRQLMMVAASAERLGLVKKGESAVVDGRLHSEVAHRLVAAAVRHGEAKAANRKARRARSAIDRRRKHPSKIRSSS